MPDGHRSGRSTDRVSCKSTELKRCSMIEMRWNKYEVSLASRKLLWFEIGKMLIAVKKINLLRHLLLFSAHFRCRWQWEVRLMMEMGWDGIKILFSHTSTAEPSKVRRGN